VHLVVGPAGNLRRFQQTLQVRPPHAQALVEAFANGEQRRHLEGVVSERSHDWRKIKTATWREANRER
jgi:hypothetical protein